MFKQELAANIPSELKSLRQWVGATADKTPLCPGTGNAASATDPSTWGTFDEVLAGALSGRWPHIGFVFTREDPYVFIDLDAPKDKATKLPLPANHPMVHQRRVEMESWLGAFESYAEESASGNGIHIIVKGNLPVDGTRKDWVELYASGRYGIFTGKVLVKQPIKDCQNRLDELVLAFKMEAQKKMMYTSRPSGMTDMEVLSRMRQASNADHIRMLWEGQWQGKYESQSEADMALIEHLCFYTPDNDQAARLFRQSALGKRAKANNPKDPYVENSINKARSSPFNAPPAADIDRAALTAQAAVKRPASTTPLPLPVELKKYPRPPGLLGEVADYIYSASVNPVREISYAAAIAFAAGICGRQYNVSNTGLNQYILILSGTGMGKGDAQSGIEDLFYEIRPTIPQIDEFMGPGDFASGSGLLRNLSERPQKSIVSVIDEFGIRLSNMSDPKANSAETTLKLLLLALYSRSGQRSIVNPTVYSDKDKNTTPVYAPALTILGLSTPTTFLKRITKEAVAEGVASRFLAVGHEGEAQVPNKKRIRILPEDLKTRICALVEVVMRHNMNSTFVDVNFTEAAERRIDAFDREIVDKRNAARDDPLMDLWNRAGLKARRLAALAAVCDNPTEPVIKVDHTNWAIEFAEADAAYMMSRFTGGYASDEDDIEAQQKVVMEKIMKGISTPPQSKDPQIQKQSLLLASGIVPYSFIQGQISNLTLFKGARQGVKNAIKSTISSLVECGQLIPCNKTQVYERFKYNGECYQLPETDE